MLSSPKMLAAAALALLLWTSAAVRADDWPQWRGPNRDGSCADTGLLESFPAAGLKVRWRAPVGWGFSSPVVAQGRVFLADSELMKPQAKERLHCLDETTGKPLWTHSYEVAYEDWAFDPTQEIGPVATPIVESGKVYTLGRLGHLFCLDVRSGNVLWKKNLGEDYQVAFAPGMPSPLIEGDLLILFYSNTSTALIRGDYLYSAKSTGELICVEASTGKQIWESDKVTNLNNGASIHLTPNGDSVLLYTDKGELIRAQLTPQGYHEISRVSVLEPTFPFAGRNVAWSAPAYANGHIFARNGNELVCASLAR